MCNAWNHPLGCTCGWGGEGHLGRSYLGNYGSHSSYTSTPSWSLDTLTSSLTRYTTCWWCGANVFFHRDKNGGCVLFDALGKPWPVHSCWEEHREEQGDAFFGVETDLIVADYDGRFYKPTGKKQTRPINSQLSTTVDGYVADNHVWYKPEKYTFLCGRRGASSAPLIEIEIADSKERLFPFLVPESTARLINDYELVSVNGRWIKRGKRWLLFATEIYFYIPGKRKGATLRGVLLPEPFMCRLCGAPLAESASWGIDTEQNFECNICGNARGRMTPQEFIDHCYRIIEINGRLTDA